MILAALDTKRFLVAALGTIIVVTVGFLVTALADGTDGLQKLVQLLVGGIGLGFIYALIALGFVLIYKAMGLFNFAQGGFVVLGAYLSYQFAEDWDLPLFVGLLCSVLTMAGVGAGIERVVMRPMLGKPVYATVLVTLGLLLIITQIVNAVWDQPAYIFISPWSGNTSTIAGVTISHGDLWTGLVAIVLLLAFLLIFQGTRLGLGMRATAINQEIAASQGVRVGLSFSASWMLAAVLGAVSGTMLVFESGGALTPALSFVALRAFPAIILGGLDSLGGAVVGGVLLGVIEVLTQGYVDVEWLGSSFETIVPYVAMVLVLWWRPEGFFGTKEVQRL